MYVLQGRAGSEPGGFDCIMLGGDLCVFVLQGNDLEGTPDYYIARPNDETCLLSR